ncbi:sodium:solute symporter family protein [Duganella sp. FT80W]|uniref:Sodium:solute symporter family protein n=1 Tax=Duganella guangzhouensis TaxID=2666084 RepID=A0A6I2KV93_9BURK|nr:sodium:solute symporter family protein [Duganella guangzhouensis]MRW89848.1 sodium:solute symporter family protein [Duganella guangzhouensis]
MDTFGVAGSVIIVTMVVLYIALTAWLTARSRSRNASEFMVGARSLPAVVVGVLMVSEFVGAKSTVGTAQAAFESGMAAAWAVLSAAVGFPLFGLVLARKLYNSGEYTISGAIFQRYGRSTQLIVSLIMIYALLLVNVGNYLSGAAVLATVLKVELPWAALLIAIVSTFYFAWGGMKSLAYVNIWHSAVKYLGVLVVLAVALTLTGGIQPMVSALPAFYFSWDGQIGASTIVAFFIGNVGAIFSTQYIVQAISSTRSADAARRATFIAAALAVPIGIALGLIGVAARYLYPDLRSLYALPIFLQSMNIYLAGFVTVSLVAAIFAAVSTVALAIASLVVRDFYLPYRRPTPEQQFRATRWLALAIGFVPLLFVLFAPGLLHLSFFTRALRLSISVVAIIGLYLPFFGGNRGATCGLIGAALTTTVWYLLGNPYGIDNMYIALVTPALVILVERVLGWSGSSARRR